MNKKETLKDLYNREKEIYKNPNKVKCFFSALDQKLEGNKLYDWYWDKIWSNVWKVCYSNPREHFQQKKYDKQRIEFGVSQQDSWSISDWLLDTMYYALKWFIEGEYGQEPIDWKERCCDTHNKKLYNEIKKYLDEYEHLMNIRKRIEIFDVGTDPTELWYPEYRDMMDKEWEIQQNCGKLLTKLLSKHLEILWW